MKRAPVTRKLMAVMLICVMVFAYTASIALQQLAPAMTVLRMESEASPGLTVLLLLALPFALPLYSSFTFARILVRRSVLAARIYLAVLAMLAAVAMLYQGRALGPAVFWNLLWVLPVVWLFFSLSPRTATPNLDTTADTAPSS